MLPSLAQSVDPLSALAKFSTAAGLTELGDRLGALRQWLLSDLGDIEKAIIEIIYQLDCRRAGARRHPVARRCR